MTYWGKAEKDGGASSPFHPLPCHSLDVAAVAECLLRRMPWLVTALLGMHDLPEGERESVLRTIVLLVAVHDLGKFANGFQKLRPEIWERAAPPEERHREWSYGGLLRHDALGAALVERTIAQGWFEGTSRGPVLAMRPWIHAACGHHGSPPDLSKAGAALRFCFSQRNIADAKAFADWARIHLGPDRMPVLREPAARRSSLFVAGVAAVADWIGSNREWFPFAPESADPVAYLAVARERAQAAVEQARVIPRRPVPAPTFAGLYPEIATPSPLQAAVDAMTFDGQCLVFIEEMTGGGKTEAANLVAAKLMAGGAAHGLYLALPTTATADAMAAREEGMYRRFFREDGASFAVAHSRAARRRAELSDAPGSTCAEWIVADRRRKSIAEICVGTVDQALLAAVTSRFASVRLFGLMGKVFVVDEAHSYDGYTQELLVGTVRLLAAGGASVVLVSATLSKGVKHRLCRAFCDGSGFTPGDSGLLDDGRYPLITVLDRQGLREPVAPAPTRHAPRPKTVRMVHSVAEAESLVLGAARSGACVLWSRNTVDDAIGAARRLKDGHGYEDVTVYHARFPDILRGRIQRALLERFGKDSRGAQRAGGIVVSTQILESSFDIDMDLVVVDLKPVDGVLQTAGRGCRHARTALGDPLPRDGTASDGREPHELVVVSPDPDRVRDADWYRSAFPAAAAVYPNVAELWRTARALRRAGEIAYPHGLRPLIAAVFDDEETPEPLHEASLRAEGGDAAERSLARPHILDPEEGYAHTVAWGDDTRVATRLGVSIEIVLVKDDGGGNVRPFDGDDWRSGGMRLSSRRVLGIPPHGIPPDAAERIAAHTGHAEIVPIVFDHGTGRWCGVLAGRERPLPFIIDGVYGLEWTTPASSSPWRSR